MAQSRSDTARILTGTDAASSPFFAARAGNETGGTKLAPVITISNCGKAGRGIESISEFERAAIAHCERVSENRSYGFRPTFLDLGTGTGYLPTQFVAKGARVVAVDCENNLMDEAKELLKNNSMRFIMKPAGELSARDLPREIHGLTAMRVLHWMPHAEAKHALSTAAAKMPTGSQLFFSIALLTSRMGAGYPLDERTPLDKRIASGTHKEFSHPATLYTPAEAVKLAEDSGFDVSGVNVTKWGMCNVRATRSDKNRKYFGVAASVPNT